MILGNLLMVCILLLRGFHSNNDAKRLYDDVTKRSRGIKLRPIGNGSSRMTLNLGLRLSQLVDVDEKNQIITTNVWLLHEWTDASLAWDPHRYNGLDRIHIPSEKLWLPDVVLYNNADGNYEVTLMTKATLFSTGRVRWEPPVIYKSFCAIDVEFYPFDIQQCSLKFGSWTYDGYQIDLKLLDTNRAAPRRGHYEREESGMFEESIDLREFYPSVEWDLLGVPGKRNEEHYPCCSEPYLDITFSIIIRRKTLFHVVNLIIPCVSITFLTVLVFFLPSESGEKISLSVSILLSLTIFFLLLAEIIPSTSLVVPLIVKHLIFTMILVTLSTLVTVGVLNVHFRSASTHTMSPWVRRMFLSTLPRLLGMMRPQPGGVPKFRSEASSVEDIESEMERTGRSRERNFRKFRTDLQGDVSNIRRKSIAVFDEAQRRSTVATSSRNRRNQSSSPRRSRAVDSYVEWKIPKPKIFVLSPSPQRELRKSSSFQIASSQPIQRSKKQPFSAMTTRKFPKAVETGSTEDAVDECFLKNIKEFRKGVECLAEHMEKKDGDVNIKEDWKFVARVLDRLFLWIFTSACVIGTAGIILQAPAIYDDSTPIGVDRRIEDATE